MKEIKLTQGQVALVDDSDFEYLNQTKWHAVKTKSGCYAARTSSRLLGPQRKIKMEWEILKLNDSEYLIDHKDHNGLNNQRYNLRYATTQQNNCNKKPKKNGSSQYLGVSLSVDNRFNKTYTYWRAGIYKNGHTKSLGLFKTEVDAALAYNKAAIDLHGEFANLNQVSL